MAYYYFVNPAYGRITPIALGSGHALTPGNIETIFSRFASEKLNYTAKPTSVEGVYAIISPKHKNDQFTRAFQFGETTLDGDTLLVGKPVREAKYQPGIYMPIFDIPREVLHTHMKWVRDSVLYRQGFDGNIINLYDEVRPIAADSIITLFDQEEPALNRF